MSQVKYGKVYLQVYRILQYLNLEPWKGFHRSHHKSKWLQDSKYLCFQYLELPIVEISQFSFQALVTAISG